MKKRDQKVRPNTRESREKKRDQKVRPNTRERERDPKSETKNTRERVKR